MAKKSKTQKAKASAARAQKRVEQEAQANSNDEQKVEAEAVEEKQPKRALFRKTEETSEPAEKKTAKKEEKKPAAPKKRRFGFLQDVRAELRRVTWPTRQDVLRWSVVVLAALIFFGLFTFGFDSLFQFLLTNFDNLGA